MTAIWVRSFHDRFRKHQHSERLSLGEKALDNSCGAKVQCSVTGNTVFLSPLSLSQSIVKSRYDLPKMFQGIFHISLGCKPVLVWPKYDKFPFFLMIHQFLLFKNHIQIIKTQPIPLDEFLPWFAL